MIKINKTYQESFEKIIKRTPDIYFNFAIDDPAYELNYLNNKDYDDTKCLDWSLIEKERYRTLKENGNWGIWCGWSNSINIIIDILESSSELSYTEIRQLMNDYTISDIFNKYSKWTWKNWIVWDRQKGRGAKHNVVSTREDFIWLSKIDKPVFNKLESNIKKKTKGFGCKNGREYRIVTKIKIKECIDYIFRKVKEL